MCNSIVNDANNKSVVEVLLDYVDSCDHWLLD